MATAAPARPDPWCGECKVISEVTRGRNAASAGVAPAPARNERATMPPRLCATNATRSPESAGLPISASVTSVPSWVTSPATDAPRWL